MTGKDGNNVIVNVYPNPARDLVHVDFVTDHPDQLQMELRNIQGVTMVNIPQVLIQTGAHSEKIDLKDVTPGIYMLMVTIGDQVTVKKIVINR